MIRASDDVDAIKGSLPGSVARRLIVGQAIAGHEMLPADRASQRGGTEGSEQTGGCWALGWLVPSLVP